MTLSFSLEQTNRPGVIRGLIWETQAGPVPSIRVYDIAEGTDIDVLDWFTDYYASIRYVRLSDGTLDEPDCLTVYEAAEAAMSPTSV